MLTRVHSSGRTCGLYPPNEHRAGCAFPHSASVTSSNLANVHTNRQQKHSTNMPLLPPKHTLPPPPKHSPSSVLSACDILPHRAPPDIQPQPSPPCLSFFGQRAPYRRPSDGHAIYICN